MRLLVILFFATAVGAAELYAPVQDTSALQSALTRLDPVDVEEWLHSLEQTEIYLRLTREAEPGFQPQAAFPASAERLAATRALIARALREAGGQKAGAALARALREGRLQAVQLIGKKDGQLRVTRYFSARVPARRRREPPHTRALYRLPPDSMRDAQGRLPTKQQIHAGALEGKTEVVAWLTPENEAELHMEGSGILVFPDGAEVAVNYEGNNGYAWGQEDEDAKARLKKQHGTVPWSAWPLFKKRHTFHRELKLEEFRHLKLKPGQFLGFDRPFHRKMPVQEGVSCAMDPGIVPSGGVALLVAAGAERRSRLVKVDDQGAAFIGRPDKIDLYWGSFTKQELKAGKREDGTPLGSFPDWGKLYFLVIPEDASSKPRSRD